MYFDAMAKLVERWGTPQMVSHMQSARLFVFEGAAHEAAVTRSPARVEFLRNMFVLPYPTVAVEDIGTCALVWDGVKGQVGLAGERYVMEFMPMDATANAGAYRDGSSMPEYRLPKGAGQITVCRWTCTWFDETTYRGHAEVMDGFIAAPDEMLVSSALFLPRVRAVDGAAAVGKNATAVIEELAHLCTSERFVVERSLVKPRAAAKGRILRAQDRPTYTLLKPDDARRYMKLPVSAPTGRHPVAHERRAHVRLLQSERFTHKRGQYVPVPACWIGPSESVVSNHRYRVILDR